MLFSSYTFILFFLPATWFVFFFLGRREFRKTITLWLVAASFFFYGWWNPNHICLLALSILFNYSMGNILTEKERRTKKQLKIIMLFCVAMNLGVIAYYKYSNFFIENIALLTGTSPGHRAIILPLAISFFTFQQIAYIVDSYRGRLAKHSFMQYCLFISFFPQLIAGPIVHHTEILPQLTKKKWFKINHKNMATGFTIFSVGLFKKVMLADGIATYAAPVFDGSLNGADLTFFKAWGGALSYTLQLYFDFSGYSDMAIGLASLFGITLPINFNSPYKASSIIDFWRRWHITLSRFLKDYLYVSLGGNRNGTLRRYRNLMITMLLGGLWHGAGWTFIIWGGLHGLYLVINHGWVFIRNTLNLNQITSKFWYRTSCSLLTFFSVVVGWVFFRAKSVQSALPILKGMAGLNGFALPAHWFKDFGWSIRLFLVEMGWDFSDKALTSAEVMWILGLLLIVRVCPNTQEFMNLKTPESVKAWINWKPGSAWAIVIAMIFFICLLNMSQIKEFLYFQF